MDQHQAKGHQPRVDDLRREFLTGYVWPCLRAMTVYEGRYLLGTSMARPILAKGQVDYALEVGADAVAHGCTGKGNDQVRFELAYQALAPELEIIAPWREWDIRSREDALDYCDRHDIEVTASRTKIYSRDRNLWHISHEGGALESPANAPPDDVWMLTVDPRQAPDQPLELTLGFTAGVPTALNGEALPPEQLLARLNELGGQHGVGRVDICENRLVGMKSRGVYETPGGTILHRALRDLEGIAMDKEVQRLRDMLSPKFAEIIYNGFWFSPEMDFLMSAVAKSQELIDGHVVVKLYKGAVYPVARYSPSSLYDQELSSMEVAGGYDQMDAQGFIRINAIRLKAHHAILQRRGVVPV